jgi:hypothetical protein
MLTVRDLALIAPYALLRIAVCQASKDFEHLETSYGRLIGLMEPIDRQIVSEEVVYADERHPPSFTMTALVWLWSCNSQLTT